MKVHKEGIQQDEDSKEIRIATIIVCLTTLGTGKGMTGALEVFNDS